jgi:two-component system chemotaxis sensor kinase CheA
LIVTHSGKTVAITCDQLRGEENVIVKGLGPVLSSLPGYLGGAILADGSVALVIDPAVLVARTLDSATRPQPPASASASPDELPAATSVLVVDDQFTIRELQRSILEAAGYRVATATDGRDALEQLTSVSAIDIVVTDIQMPEMDGLELLRGIRADPALSSLPVVVVTSLAGDEDRRRGLEAGADAYVTKDRFDQRVLLETVGRLVGP